MKQLLKENDRIVRCRLGIIASTLVLLVLVLFVGNGTYDLDANNLFSIHVQKNKNSVLISPWVDENGYLYVVLPSYADMLSTKILVDGNTDIRIDGKRINKEMDCGSYQLEVPYKVTHQIWGSSREFLLTFLQSANVSTMYIDTESKSMDYIHSKKRNAEAGIIWLYQENGELQYHGTLKSITGRGNTTWDDYEKKSYTIDLGEDKGLLGMGAARDWVLLANAADPSHMRNKIVYDFSEKAGLPYSPESRWVDLYLNGEYAGLYLLSEQNEVHAERIAIENPDSFLVTIEGRGRMVSQNLPYIETEKKQALRIRYPKNPSATQLQELTQIWNRIENAILKESHNHLPNSEQWTMLIDLESWARKYLVEEIFGNLDASYKSQFFYYDGNDENARVMAGPVWDYDLAMGRTWHTENHDFLWANRLHVDDQYDTPWFHELYKKAEFLDRVKEGFKKEMLPLLKELYEEQIGIYDNQIAQAAKMNQIRWKTESYADEVELLKSYLARRIDFLTRIWLEERRFHLIEARSEGASYAYFAVEDGRPVPSLPVLESSETRVFKGWYTEDGKPFDEKAAIYEDVCIYAKWDGISHNLTMYAQYFLPLTIIAFLGMGILVADILRTRKGG